MVDDTTRRQQAEAERCALLELLLVLSQRPGQRMPAAQLRQLAAALHSRLFVVPRRTRQAGHAEVDASQYAVDLVRWTHTLTGLYHRCTMSVRGYGTLPSPGPAVLLESLAEMPARIATRCCM